METQTSNWHEISKLLREARDCLPIEQGARQSSSVPAGLLTGTLDEFEEFLEHHELELAWDALATVAERVNAPAACWRRLARAAGLMRLLAKENQALQHATPAVSSDQALNIARSDGEKAYGNLLGYRISVVLEPDGWHVDYDLTEPYVAGGGPHYVIDPATGAILSKRYEQ